MLLAGCARGDKHSALAVQSADPARRGRMLIAESRCGSCHTIPGIQGATGQFGPPLMAMSRRVYIAGEFPNSAETLADWIKSPTSLKPGTTMPDLGLTRQQAADIAAYLETLR